MIKIENFILITVWVVSFISLLFINKDKYRKASFIFLFAQAPAWIFGVLVVEHGLLKYPYRYFKRANFTSFTFEFLILPIISIFFNIYYPQNETKIKKFIYCSIYSSSLTIFEVTLEKYTNLIKYTGWKWYWTWITICMFLHFVRLVYVWFFQLHKSKDF